VIIFDYFCAELTIFMQESSYNIIGVMSGTSLDGIDLAYITFKKENHKWAFDIHQAETIPYSEDWVLQLKNGIHLGTFPLAKLNHDYTLLLADVIQNFINKYQIQNIDAVCSHGHTIKHEPDKGFTLQIGNLSLLAEIIKRNVVCDFRVQDVALGGQGAPLVPIGDELLFSQYDFCLNLGGFSNVSFNKDGQRIAFDICPINTVLNHLANQLDLPYDKGGEIAKRGQVHLDLLKELNTIEYYQKQPPKSLGVEFLSEVFYPILNKYQMTIPDLMRTCVAHFSDQLAYALNKPNTQVICTGGGAYHQFLIHELQLKIPETVLYIPDDNLIQFKEALIFGFLGVLRLREEVNVLASVTGATKDHSSGVIFGA
jgi:anhydro-N-acetylmuramic acid kinase